MEMRKLPSEDGQGWREAEAGCDIGGIGLWTLYQGDCLKIMRDMPANSIDSCVTDPPYELGFMGKSWDSTGIAYNVDMWREVLRILKPGGYLLSFGGTRTYHRMACAIEDAGFEIRDQMQWIYGSGFPKSMDISKAIDKAAGEDREILACGDPIKRMIPGSDQNKTGSWIKDNGREYIPTISKAATIEAQQWDGWGTALKPANEPIVVARKPLSEKTVVDNVLKWGTGGINIDECRVKYEVGGNVASNPSLRTHINGGNGGNIIAHEEDRRVVIPNTEGRFPANAIFDEEAAAMLDVQSGERKAGGKVTGDEPSKTGQNGIYGIWNRVENKPFDDQGGASRFFYCAKASRSERYTSKHPTIKPLMLMQYLVRLVTPPNGTAIDPFAGSGTTMQAAVIENFNAIGIEKEVEHCADIRIRMANIEPSLWGMGG